ncbi:hypothetical protein B0A49_10433 [Cryomyces minteri]|uniref:Transcriptional regulatory protein DEP1 n=1 Tax=Cryomyces minteri TaxID=331657 RepID=A0A4U0WKK7_9PEZI|nr:hypothetical protein B0A49_10433 [Cryomyces minteri]
MQSIPSILHTLDAQSDGRSSSLSDLEDGQYDGDGPVAAGAVGARVEDNDSEAETEKLERSPQKFSRVMEAVMRSGNNLGRSPSKLSQHFTADEDLEEPGSPTARLGRSARVGSVDENSLKIVKSLNSIAVQSVEENDASGLRSRKRKRPSPAGSSLSDDPDSQEPSRKRSNSDRSDIQPQTTDRKDRAAIDALVHEDHRVEVARKEEGLLAKTSDVKSPDDDHATPGKGSKSNKGKRKGKKLKESAPVETPNGVGESDAVEVDEVADGEPDDDAGVTTRDDQELHQKKFALDSLEGIEKDFATFKHKLYDERIEGLSNEIALLQHPNSTHADYLAMIQCVNARRDEKIRHEQILLDYKLQSLKRVTVAERSQFHSQYFQEVRDIRERALEDLGEHWFNIQKERRQWQADEPELVYKFPTKRSQQVLQQSKYNLEVSVLSGVAKYVGFPAAPEMEGAKASELEEDLRAMKIPKQQPQPYNSIHYLEPARAENRAAEEQFLEQTPWANPQHPVHAAALYPEHRMAQQQGSRNTSNPFTTPASRKRVTDLHAPNGSSSSTIGIPSDPPSSVVPAPPTGDRMQAHPSSGPAGSDSPLDVTKRNAAARRDFSGVSSASTIDAIEQIHSSSTHHSQPPHRTTGVAPDASALHHPFHASSVGPNAHHNQPARTGLDREAPIVIYDNPPFPPPRGSFGTPGVTPRPGPNTLEAVRAPTELSTSVKREEESDRDRDGRFGFGVVHQRPNQMGVQAAVGAMLGRFR